jgi:NAD(P)-dependent dehydrogenase (short-subunit alcohol dehydrogenase family)
MAWREAQIPSLAGRSAVVTGANSGIGWHTARELAAHAAHVVLACRDPDRGKQAADRILADHPAGSVEVVELDLAAMTSVRDFAESLSRRDEPLDLLVNNAGVMAPPRRTYTADGFERQFGTNHLGHFALTGLLLPTLLRAPGSRVVTVASIAHFGGGDDVVDGNVAGDYHGQRAYANSKLANLLFAFELQRRATGYGLPLASTAAHPGVSATGLVTSRDGVGTSRVVRAVGPLVLKMFTQSAAAGARATLYAATVAAPGTYTGPQRLGERRGPIGPARMSARAREESLARRLWDVSEELTGLRYPWPGRH